MNMKSSLILLLLALLLVSARGWAQNAAKPAPPPGPLVGCSACNSEWTITFAYPDEKNKKPPSSPADKAPAYLAERTRSLRTVKTNNVIHETYLAINGNRNDKWYVDAVEFRKKEKERTWLVDRPPPPEQPNLDPNYTGLPATGFRDLEKVSDKTYLGSTSFDGHNCLVFNLGKDKIDFGKQDEVNSAKDIAFIDLDTRMPVEVRHQGVVQMYAFGEAPAGTQALPEDLTTQIQLGNRMDARLAARAPRPY